MRKAQTLGVALFAAVAVAAVLTASASAAEWLKNGTPLTGMQSATTDGTYLVIHKGGGWGNVKLECNIALTGLVEPRGLGLLTSQESLNGSEKSSVKCKTLEGACTEASLDFANKLLELEFTQLSSILWLRTLTHARWKDLCLIGSLECEFTILRMRFEGNGTNGAKFAFKGVESGESTCSDGGTEVAESIGTAQVLGFTVS
jgi:hypothetical protein